MPDARLLRLRAGDVLLESGTTLPDVELVVATYGEPSPARDNVVVLPTHFGGTHADNEYLIGPGRALDPARWFVVVPNMLGNGVSTSPSTAAEPFAGPRFPLVTPADDVRLQRRVLREALDVDRVELAVGWSMGGQQAYHWAVLFPEAVQRLAVICGAARTTPHTAVFVEGMLAVLGAAADPDRARTALGRAWAPWALSQAWYRRAGWRELGFASVEDYLVRSWDVLYREWDPADLAAMLRTWRACDVAAGERFGGDLGRALGAVRARTLVMPGRTDLYFPPEDAEAEVALLPDARLEVIPSDWGHYAGGGRDARDTAFVERHLAALLAA